MAHRKPISNWPRYILQWGVLAAIILFLTGIIKTANPADPETYCPLGGLQAFVTYLVRGSLPCSMSSVQIMMGLALAAGIILFSKLFCAYICPVGTVEDLLIKLRKAIHLKNIKVKNGGAADKALRIFKYALLFWIFYSTVTASELFCKSLDPYYAVATGFKGEIVLWMSIVTLSLVILGGILVDNFWCRYICPLGAASNTLKFWLWCGVLAGICSLLGILGVEIAWWIILGAFCLMGYLLEIFGARPKLQLLYVQKDLAICNHCGACEKKCPYHIEISAFDRRIEHVDCTMCGECITACKTEALHIGMRPHSPKKCILTLLPAILAVALTVAGIVIGSKFELPTIDETWGIYSKDSLKTALVDENTLETVKLEGLKQIHCFGSSRAFMNKLMKIKGVHGVKTYVRSHSAVILFDPARTNAEKINEEIYVPSCYKSFTPDYKATPELKVLTIRTENMPASTDLNFLGIQFKLVDSLVYGLDSEWDCPLIVHLYVDPAFDKDEKWIRSIVEKPSLDLPRKDGTIKSTPTGYKYVRMEKEVRTIPTTEFLQKMFTRTFEAEFKGKYPQGDTTVIRERVEVYAGKPQKIYEVADEMLSKPLISKGLPFLSNHLSANEGVIGMYVRLNRDYVPSLQIRFASPMTEKKLWELMTMPEWTITYKKDDVRVVPAKILFKKPGKVYDYVEAAKPVK